MNKSLKNLIGTLLAGLFLLVTAGSALAGGSSHQMTGMLVGTTNYLPLTFKMWIATRSGEIGSNACGYQASRTYYNFNIGNLTTAWSNGEVVVAVTEKDGGYSVTNLSTDSTLSAQTFPDATFQAIPIPAATGAVGQVDVSWSAAVDSGTGNIAGYNVYRDTSAGGAFATKVNGAVVAGTTYSDTTGTVGTTYFYKIKLVFRGAPTQVESTYFSAASNGAAPQAAGLNITVTTLPAGTVGTAYSQTVSVSGGTAPYTWALSAGSLPAGLTLNTATGLISGTPTTAQTANFTILVTDAVAATDSQALAITINAVPPSSPTITQLELTSVPGTPITSANIGDGISIIGTNFGATQGTSTITINGAAVTNFWYWSDTKIDIQVPTGATSGNVIVTVDGAPSNGSPLTISGGSTGGTAPSITSISPSTAAIGQTIVLSGANFGASKSVSTVTIGGIAAKPTAWSDTSITLAVPTGVATGTATVLITVAAQSGSNTMTIDGASVYLDDFEGGSVGNWLDPNTSSGYYAFDNGVTPDNSNINAQGLSGEAAYGGTGRGMRIKYSYTTGYGGGWGAILANTLDLSSASQIGFNVRWDGSSNSIKLALKDVDGTSYATTISASTLALVSGYGQVTVQPSSFSYDAAGSSTGADTTFSWNAVASYNFIYATTGTTSNYQYIDNLVATLPGSSEGGTTVPTGEAPYIVSVDPAASPAGARFTVSGLRFGSSEGESILLFENTTTGKSYFADITSWSETTIEAIVPAGAATGIYKMKVVRKSIALGIVRALESNEAGYSVTIAAVAGLANAWPNPFNAGSESINISIPSAGGAANIGWYIYDMTAKLAYKTAGSATQISWSGRDINANLPVADGAYILRVVNEDTRTLLAKGKILVVKR